MSDWEVAVSCPTLDRLASPAQVQRANALTTARMAADMNEYVKYDTGSTHDSMANAANYEHGEISWTTPYARYAYYDPHVVSTGHPKATSRWAEAADRELHQKWLDFYRRALYGEA